MKKNDPYDIDLIEESQEDLLQELTDKVNGSSKRLGLKVNAEKIVGRQIVDVEMKLENEKAGASGLIHIPWECYVKI